MRLRINQKEAASLAAGGVLKEEVAFGVGATLSYALRTGVTAGATFDGRSIEVSAPLAEWARGGELGFYFEMAPGLKVAIEKDLECVDGPEEEKDPDAFPRGTKNC